MKAEDLNKCLRGELSAIQTYKQALEHGRKHPGDEQKLDVLERMLDEHEQAASRVRGLVQQMGGTPVDKAGAWGTWSRTLMGTAKLFGDKAALKALKEGEESGVKAYESVVQDPGASPEVKQAIGPILANEQEHVRTLDRLLEAA